MKKLLATCDRIIARLPLRLTEESIVGGIIIPPEALEAMKRHAIVELEIVAAGPDCKVARTGDHVVVNKNVCSPLEWEGAEYMVFSEVTAFAIIKEQADVKAPVPVSVVAPEPVTMAEIKAALNIPDRPVDDASALPVESPASAPLEKKTT